MRIHGCRNQNLSIIAIRLMLVIGVNAARLTLFQLWFFAEATLDRTAVRSKAAVASARKMVGGIYNAAGSALKTAAQRSALARNVPSDSALAKTNAERCAMLSLASRLMEQGGDEMLVLKLYDQVASNLSVDTPRVLAEIFAGSTADARAENWALC